MIRLEMPYSEYVEAHKNIASAWGRKQGWMYLKYYIRFLMER